MNYTFDELFPKPKAGDQENYNQRLRDKEAFVAAKDIDDLAAVNLTVLRAVNFWEREGLGKPVLMVTKARGGEARVALVFRELGYVVYSPQSLLTTPNSLFHFLRDHMESSIEADALLEQFYRD